MAANQSGTAAPPPEDRKRVHRMIEATIPAPLLRAASRLLPDGVKRAVNAAIAVPTTPGQWGAFELAAGGVLLWLQVPQGPAFSFGLLYHGVQVAPLLVVLLCELPLVATALRAARRTPGTAATQSPP